MSFEYGTTRFVRRREPICSRLPLSAMRHGKGSAVTHFFPARLANVITIILRPQAAWVLVESGKYLITNGFRASVTSPGGKVESSYSLLIPPY